MLKKRFSPKLNLKTECVNDEGNVFTVIKIDSLLKLVKEYRLQVKKIVDKDNDIIKLVVNALILYYCWNKDFLDVGLEGLPSVDDLETVEEITARERLIECIIESMHDVDHFHPEFRTLCTNVSSVSLVNVYNSLILLSINITNGNLH